MFSLRYLGFGAARYRQARARESDRLTTPTLTWLGVRPTEVLQLEIPPSGESTKVLQLEIPPSGESTKVLQLEIPPSGESTKVLQLEIPPSGESTKILQLEIPPSGESTKVLQLEIPPSGESTKVLQLEIPPSGESQIEKVTLLRIPGFRSLSSLTIGILKVTWRSMAAHVWCSG